VYYNSSIQTSGVFYAILPPVELVNPFLMGSSSDDDLPRQFGLSRQERVKPIYVLAIVVWN